MKKIILLEFIKKDTINNFGELCRKEVQLDVKKVIVETSRNLMKNAPQDIAYIVGLVVVFFLMFEGKIQIGACVAFTTLLGFVSEKFGRIVTAISHLHGAIANSEDLCQIMELEEEMIEKVKK